ncbi:MAG: hypothetical protein JO368_05200, partial [Acidimicrobiales bacterium]|nr:hypothetical protein [Acidimicrobiales bacterium]
TDVDPTTDNPVPLFLERTAGHWNATTGPVPGSSADILGGIAAVGGSLWTAGLFAGSGNDLPLLEHH